MLRDLWLSFGGIRKRPTATADPWQLKSENNFALDHSCDSIRTDGKAHGHVYACNLKFLGRELMHHYVVKEEKPKYHVLAKSLFGDMNKEPI